MPELNVALRVQAQLDQARKAIQDLKSEVQSLDHAAGNGNVGAFDASGAQAATTALQQQSEAAAAATSAQIDLTESTDQAAAAEQQRAAATSEAAAASGKNRQATEQLEQATDDATVATERERRALDALMSELVPGAEAANRLAGAQNELNMALSKGLITQEQHTRMMALAQQRWAGSGITARQTAAAMRMLPAQITDITTSIASGMPVWLVALQQGGQIKDSFGGIGPAARAMAGAIRGAMLVYAGLAASIGTLIFAYVSAQREESALRESIIMTGNAAGVSVDMLYEMAYATSAIVGTTGKAAETLAQLTATGQVARQNMQQFAQTAIEMEIALGRSWENVLSKHRASLMSDITT